MKLNRVLIVVRIVPKPAPKRCSLRLKGRKAIKLNAEHAKSLKSIIADLDEIGIAYRVVGRDDLKGKVKADLIISIGGDGTFLASSHHADNVPVLGVNPDPKTSVGFFCIAKTKSFRVTLKKAMAGSIKPTSLPLIETRIGSKKLPLLALNDVLFAGHSPAETVRYRLTVDGEVEEQKSSGIWIAAGPGSTAAISSAGGKRQPITSKKLQFLVREPYPAAHGKNKKLRGILKEGADIAIHPSMGRGMIYIDGHGNSYPVPWKSKVTCRVSSKSLKIFI